MKKTFFAGAACAVLAVCASQSASAETLRFTKDCERALALSAGPAYMRDGAGVYLLGDDGFELDRPETNGYVCIAVREGSGMAPQCFDEAGQVSHVPVVLDEAKKKIDGTPKEQLRKDRAEGFAKGLYRPAPVPGVVYMASAYNYVENGRGEKLHVGPHVMYHAPFIQNKDLASDPGGAFQNLGMPFMNEPGPLGFMISFVERPTDSSAVEKSCKGQLPDPSGWSPVPDRG